jgi:hypothetical protein
MLTAKEKAKNSYLLRIYHITLVQYRLILKRQDGCCAICMRKMNFLTKKGKPSLDFAVDHCHKTGLIRGLLCMDCNRTLGRWRDNDAKVIAAAEYVKFPPAVDAIGATYTALGRVGTKVRKVLLTKLKQEASGSKRKRQ